MKPFRNVSIPLQLVILGFILSGCLQTRNDVREGEQKQVIQKQVVDLQRTTADVSTRFSDIEEQLRFFNGRIENLESKFSKNDQNAERAIKGHGDNIGEINKKLSILQEALTKMESQMNQIQGEMASLKSDHSAQQSMLKEAAKEAKETNEKKSKDEKRNTYDVGLEYFKQKDWKKSIIEFSKYRDKNPNGKYYGDSTYKIGVCFQELGDKDDAKTFYQEVISRFPNSDEARRAKTRLKGLK